MWRIVGTLDGDGDLRRAGEASCVTHGVREDVVECVGGGAQSLDSCVIVVNGVGVGAIGSDGDRTE